MCIRDSVNAVINYMVDKEGISADRFFFNYGKEGGDCNTVCLLYTSDAADERSSVDLGGRRIIKKKKERSRMRDLTHRSKKENISSQHIVTVDRHNRRL